MALSIRRTAVGLLACCAFIVAGMMAVAAPAQAGHNNCSLWAYTPWKGTWSGTNNRYIHFEAYVDCGWDTPGRLFFEAQRHRWWGWQQLTEEDMALGERGNRRLEAKINCPGGRIDEGTWTFRTLATLTVQHWWGFDGWTDLSGEYRTGCYD